MSFELIPDDIMFQIIMGIKGDITKNPLLIFNADSCLLKKLFFISPPMSLYQIFIYKWFKNII